MVSRAASSGSALGSGASAACAVESAVGGGVGWFSTAVGAAVEAVTPLLSEELGAGVLLAACVFVCFGKLPPAELLLAVAATGALPGLPGAGLAGALPDTLADFGACSCGVGLLAAGSAVADLASVARAGVVVLAVGVATDAVTVVGFAAAGCRTTWPPTTW